MTLYLASPLGFSPELRTYLEKVKNKIRDLGWNIFDPWEQTELHPEIEAAWHITDCAEREAAFRDISSRIGHLNEKGIRTSQALLAILDGPEVDSGTASEVGFASALGLRCFGLRTDLRDSGDFPGIPINLQVLHFIERSGGRLFRKIDEIELS